MKKLTPDSTIAEALKNKSAVAYAERMKPGITRHPALLFVKKLTLEEARKLGKVSVSHEQLIQILSEINNMDF